MTITPEYQEALLDMRKNYIWGYSGGKYAGQTICNFLQEFPEIETILDYGCGGNALKEWVEEKGITDKKWTLYDPGVPEFKDPQKVSLIWLSQLMCLSMLKKSCLTKY